MREKDWDSLMERARRASRMTGERRKVIGVRLPRTTDLRQKWVYVVSCGTECSVCRGRRPRAARVITS